MAIGGSTIDNALNTLLNNTKTSGVNTNNPFGFIVDDSQIKNALDLATNAAYDQSILEANRGLNTAEDQSFTNTQNSINELRKSLIGSASRGSNVGAANATALQALLGLGQSNSALTTTALQGVQDMAGQRATALAQNAGNAINQANTAKSSQATAANEAYSADALARQYANQAVGTLASAIDTNYASDKMNNATNATNKTIANTTSKQIIYNRK